MTATTRAVVVHAPHDLRVEATSVSEPGPGQVLVAVEAGGICGSDLHYFHDGGFGTVRIREPMILGHEVAGRVEALGAGVREFSLGQRVALSPSNPCGHCRYCQLGLQQHCLDMRFYGSAMRFPHVQGAFRDLIVADAHQCHAVVDGLSAGEAAMAEPLAVCLHAVRRAGPLLGKRVLVTGSGPIGALAAIAARRAGAAEIVTTDVAEAPLEVMRGLGVEQALNVATAPDALAAFTADKGHFDVLFEASGNERALTGALAALRPAAVIVQIGIGSAMTLPMNVVVAKEFDLRGTFRFHEEFGLAVALMSKRLVDVKPLISATLPAARAVEAFNLASDRTKAMKVQLAFR
ncbi:MAG: L-idonate 5-dehydrogenase [Hyphomicrobiaceae bacterium]